MASGGREARTGLLAPQCARSADLLVRATGQNRAGLARTLAAAALDIATDAHGAGDYEAAMFEPTRQPVSIPGPSRPRRTAENVAPGDRNALLSQVTWRRNVARRSPEDTADQPTALQWCARSSAG